MSSTTARTRKADLSVSAAGRCCVRRLFLYGIIPPLSDMLWLSETDGNEGISMKKIFVLLLALLLVLSLFGGCDMRNGKVRNSPDVTEMPGNTPGHTPVVTDVPSPSATHSPFPTATHTPDTGTAPGTSPEPTGGPNSTEGPNMKTAPGLSM